MSTTGPIGASGSIPHFTADNKLAEAVTPDGGRLILYEHGRDFCVRLNGLQLMHSAAAASELLLGEVAVESLSAVAAPRILIGGLGLGFTLRSVLQRVGPRAAVQVAELVLEVVAWNRRFLSRLNGALLDDLRVEILLADVWQPITCAGRACYDAVLLDVDNGPRALVRKQNARLYSRTGLKRIAAALKPGGRAVFWSADPAPGFAARLADAGFRVKTIPARFCPTAQHCAGAIYAADR